MDTMTKVRFTLRLDNDLYARTANLARVERRSLNSQVELLVELGLAAIEPLEGLVAAPEEVPEPQSLKVTDEELQLAPAEAKRQSKKPLRKEMCVHRVPAGSWCKRCDE